MKIVSLTQREEIGGFVSLEILILEDIVRCPIILTNTNATTFLYKKGYTSAVEIKPVRETLSVGSKSSKTKSGRIYSIESNFEVLHLDTEVDSIFATIQNKKVIVKANKYNGTSIIYGSLKYPLTFFYDVVNSTKTESPSKFEIKIKGKIPQKPVIYTPT